MTEYNNCKSYFISWYMKLLSFLLMFTSCLTFTEENTRGYKNWDFIDQRLWDSYIFLNTADMFQTFDMIDKQRDPNYNIIEANPFLGERPKKLEVVVLKVVGTYIAYRVLDRRKGNRTLALVFMNGVYVNTIAKNHQAGLTVELRF